MVDLSVVQTVYSQEGKLTLRRNVDEAARLLFEARGEYPAYRIRGVIEYLLRGKFGKRHEYARQKLGEIYEMLDEAREKEAMAVAFA